jgi:hypothetical protein
MIGRVNIDSANKIRAKSVDPAYAKLLEDVLAGANRLTSLPIDAVPPADARRFSDYSARVARTDPHFRDTLFDFLRRYYALEFRAAP